MPNYKHPWIGGSLGIVKQVGRDFIGNSTNVRTQIWAHYNKEQVRLLCQRQALLQRNNITSLRHLVLAIPNQLQYAGSNWDTGADIKADIAQDNNTSCQQNWQSLQKILWWITNGKYLAINKVIFISKRNDI